MDQWWTDALGGVEEAVEGIVGRLQIKQHLAHLIIIQLVWGWHAAEGGQPEIKVDDSYDKSVKIYHRLA